MGPNMELQRYTRVSTKKHQDHSACKRTDISTDDVKRLKALTVPTVAEIPDHAPEKDESPLSGL
jgi:hypothetical protein